MGFLDSLLKRGARKLVAGVLDDVTDNVRDSIREKRSGSATTVNTADNVTATARQSYSADGPDADCCNSVKVVEQRIRNVVSEEWGDRIEVRKNIKASEMCADAGALDYTYGLYYNGAPVAMIILLTPPNYYWNKRTRLAREACERQRVGYVHFIMRLPNRTCYIREQLKKSVNI